ncbi:glycosyltransferase family 4 protein [Haloarcula sp. S1AR25-5A]|uniref:Glycosyltransferase family 4 protein n=1 Tax=Haloarcula terrestris TaxID=2950533 RepID=A0AAE4EXE0_9EURY|nr:glycosyltransferase family 4 protein [Haloarcula terrestris]MDS0221682.1 glycosyltransferase family 4 protein [Haloarcula terrestris]
MNLGFQSTIDYGGVGRFTTELLKELGPLCEEITVYPTPISVDDPTSHQWWTDMPSNIKIAEKKGLVPSLIRDSFRFGDHDVIHINYASYGSPAIVNKLARDIPFVFTHHYGGTPTEMSSSIKHKFEYLVEQSIFLPLVCRTGHVVSVSEYNAGRLPKYVNADVIYHGGSSNLFEQTSPKNLDSIGLSSDENIILFTGKLHGFKDGWTTIKGFEKANKMFSEEIKLVLATGSGGYDAESIHEYLETESVFDDQIVLIKDIDDVTLHTLYEVADVFAFPSYAESFGLVFLEAMEAGTPIIHSDGGAAPEIVSDAGIEIEAKNTQECAEAIVDLIDNEELNQELKKRGYERREEFSWKKAANKYYKIYNNI